MADMRRFLDLTGLEIYDNKIKTVISTGDANMLAEAKKYFDDNKNLFEAAGSVKTAQEALQAAIDAVDGKITAITNGESIDSFADVETALAGKQAVGDYATKAEAQAMADGKDTAIAEAKSAAETAAEAAEVADGKAEAAQADVDELAAYVGTIPTGYTETNVIAYINKKAEETLNAASGGSSESAASVLQALNTYKAENDPKVNKNTEDIAGLVADLAEESERAVKAEEANAAAIKAISDDYLKAADKTELQGNINTVSAAVERLTNGVSADEVDGVNDLIQYVKDHGTEVTGMQEDIADNAEAIADVAGRMDTAEGKITAVEGAVATKAEKSYVDEQIGVLNGVDTGLSNRITELENKFGTGDGSVADMIADAKAEAIEAAAAAADTKDEAVLAAAKKHAEDEDAKVIARVAQLETDSATHALASDLTELAGKVTTAEGEIDTLQAGLEAAVADIATKAAAADLNTLSGKVTVNEGAISTLNSEMDAVEGRLDDVEDALDGKAEASAVESLTTRMGTAESNIAANTAALAKFVEISQTEIEAMFA